jgi:hypothetical protein
MVPEVPVVLLLPVWSVLMLPVEPVVPGVVVPGVVGVWPGVVADGLL